jgi:hypothetical protein
MEVRNNDDCGENGGAEGIRTLDLLDAIEARSQLRHGPTGKKNGYFFYSIRRRRASNRGRSGVSRDLRSSSLCGHATEQK